MKHPIIAFIVIGVLSCTALAAYTAQPGRSSVLIDSAWKFTKEPQTDAQMPEFDDGAWRSVDLPHDWSIEGPYSETNPTGGSGGYLPAGVGWYRKNLTVPESMRGKKVIIEFDGIYMNSDVWLNGHHLGNYPCGYSSFYYDLTPWLNFDGKNNVLAVRVDNSKQPNSRWYSGSGIYRHVLADGNLSPARGSLGDICDHAESFGEIGGGTHPHTRSKRIREEPPGHAGERNSRRQWPRSSQRQIQNKTSANAANSNSIKRSTCVIRISGRPITRISTAFTALCTIGGQLCRRLRDAHRHPRHPLRCGSRFLLNGEPVKMLGMCVHHDGGCVGAAVPEGVWERRLRLLKAMGCNAIRMSHNPPAPELLDLCDRLGFLVMDEAFDQWRIAKARRIIPSYFADWSIKDLTALLHRDRNHPCVVMWSAGNEIGNNATNGPAVLQTLVELATGKIRPGPSRRPATTSSPIGASQRRICRTCSTSSATITSTAGAARREPISPMTGTSFRNEKWWGPRTSASAACEALTTSVRRRPAHSSVADTPSSMIRAEQLWKFNKVHDYVIGYFMWTGIDYLGESRWPGKESSPPASSTPAASPRTAITSIKANGRRSR